MVLSNVQLFVVAAGLGAIALTVALPKRTWWIMLVAIVAGAVVARRSRRREIRSYRRRA